MPPNAHTPKRIMLLFPSTPHPRRHPAVVVVAAPYADLHAGVPARVADGGDNAGSGGDCGMGGGGGRLGIGYESPQIVCVQFSFELERHKFKPEFIWPIVNRLIRFPCIATYT